MERLRIDTEMLRETGAELRVVADEFSRANATSEDVAAAVGHPKLAEQMRSFADSWDDTRENMVQAIAGLAQTASAAGETFEQLDSELAATLKGQ